MARPTLTFLPAAGAALLLPALLVGCGGAGAAAPAGGGCARVAEPAPRQRTLAQPSLRVDPGRTYPALSETNCGSFTIRLDPARSPHAVASFVALTRAGFFDRTIFYRIVPGRLIEGGDPTATGNGGPGYATADRPAEGVRYSDGVVAMQTVAGRPGSAGSRFFIVTAPHLRLPPRYAILGAVTSGLAVVERIGALGGGGDLPAQVENVSALPTRVVEIERGTIEVS